MVRNTAEKIGAATAASWKNRKVRAARSIKHRVRVNGIEHKSVRAAFVALHLDLCRHAVFRKQLKESGRKKFDRYTFVLVANV